MSQDTQSQIAESKVKQAFVGLQMLFVAFGALVLVPLITGLTVIPALLTAGVGTLLFHHVPNAMPIFLSIVSLPYCN